MVSVLIKEPQILLIKKFIISDEDTLLVNQVNDELGIFYLSIVKYYADKQGIKINIMKKEIVFFLFIQNFKVSK